MAEKNTKTTDKKEASKKAALKKAAQKEKLFKRMTGFFKDTKAEIKKIVWPTPKAAWKSTAVVLGVMVVTGAFVFLLDTGFVALLSAVMNVAA